MGGGCKVAVFEPMAPDVYRLAMPFPGCWTGVALVRGEENILIDSGGGADAVDQCLAPALARLGLGLGDIAWLAMTHIHGDHVGGCARILQLSPGTGLAVFRASARRMEEPLAYSKEIRARFPGHSPPPPAILQGAVPDRLLEDGDRLGPVRLVHTPGHDSDSCCYWDGRSRTLITGDSLQLNGTVSQGCALLMDPEAYVRSLERLMEMDIHHIVCGHPYLPLGAEAIGPEASRRYLRACHRAAARDEGFVRGMMAAGETEASVIARALIRHIGGTEPQHLFLPLHTVVEYMKKGDRLP